MTTKPKTNNNRPARGRMTPRKPPARPSKAEPTGFGCESPECTVDGVGREELCEAEDGSLWCRTHFPAPPLVFELWYEDGGVGGYKAETQPEKDAVEFLWRLFNHRRDNQGRQPARILIRHDAPEADEASPELILRNILREIADAKDENGEWNSTDWVGNSIALETAQKHYGDGFP